ncbi:putative baseplate assembly protein [Brevibacillus dissolubilis]|uniref:putative baseplate assembly protein n=1 Tax=Brevibacillus dissolubilis TaxID=1844116 RepID=UPI0011162344|nr:putative baseplate assembly protein [Brevibacillus dissolubilis]
MLPLPNLDDRRFEQLVQEAQKAIPHVFPQWTDENDHDPGITMLEMLAWLVEMQQYYLNRVTAKNERKFLKLLGMRPHEAGVARTDVVFESEEPIFLPKGLQLRARDLIFETTDSLLLLPHRIEKVLVRQDTESYDVTPSNIHAGIAYHAFGKEAKRGNQLYIGLDRPLPEMVEITLTIDLYEQYPVACLDDSSDFAFVPSAVLLWEYYSESDGWQELRIVRDETVHFSQSGRLRLVIPEPMGALTIHPANEKKRYWLRCTVESGEYELAPKIEQISLHMMSVENAETLSHAQTFRSTGEPDQIVEVNDYLSLYGWIEVQVSDSQGFWHTWTEVESWTGCGADEEVYRILPDVQMDQADGAIRTRKKIIQFGDGMHGKIPRSGAEVIRVISYQPDVPRQIGRSNGLPGQTFRFPEASVLTGPLIIQVGHERRDDTGRRLVWEDWQEVDDFDHSRPNDRHLVVDREEEVIRFGDNVHGEIPYAMTEEVDNIRILQARIGGGERGNVKPGLITQVAHKHPDFNGITLTNPAFAMGGSERETLASAKQRIQHEWQQADRAVTSEDYERIVQAIPGIRVARVKALPLYKPGMKDYPRRQAPAQLTIVVVPYSEAIRPTPSAGMLETVRRHLEQHRLLTTEVHVIAPEYIKVTVHATVISDPKWCDHPRPILSALLDLLTPLHTTEGGGVTGWDFGEMVYKGDLYEAISRVPGVLHVQDLWLDATGAGAHKEASGNIAIPPHGLIYSGEHVIEVIHSPNKER